MKKVFLGAGMCVYGFFLLHSTIFALAQTYSAEYYEQTTIACTQEAKLCSDGSYVSRTGENCEFALCPDEKADISDPVEDNNEEDTRSEKKDENSSSWVGTQQLSAPDNSQGGDGDPDRPIITGEVVNQTDEANANDLSLEGGATPFLLNAVEVRGWDPEKKEAFLKTVKTYAELRSSEDLENFARGVLLSDENIKELEITDKELKMEYRMPAKFLGIFSVSLPVYSEVVFGDGENGRIPAQVKVRYPWSSFLYKKYVSADEIEMNFKEESGLADLDDWIVLSEKNFAKTGEIIEKLQEALKKGLDKSHRLLRGR